VSLTHDVMSHVQILLRTVEVSVRVSVGRPIILSEDPLEFSQDLQATDGTVPTVGQDGSLSHRFYSVLRGHVNIYVYWNTNCLRHGSGG
jgi:hypothetical protein